jgi:hypothetical protein
LPAAAGAASCPRIVLPGRRTRSDQKRYNGEGRVEGSAMRYRRLGATGLEVSVIGLGTWQLGGEWGKQFTQPEVERLVGRAGELGVNVIDTAEC